MTPSRFARPAFAARVPPPFPLPTMPTDSERPKRQPSVRTQNIIAVIAGLITFAVGAGWVIYSYVVDREAPYFAIPLVFSVPVIVAVAIRSFWD